jgi:hypothetical protein
VNVERNPLICIQFELGNRTDMKVQLLILAVISAPVLSQDRGINLTVYLTSMCKDSQRFITEQLLPYYERFKDRLNVEFVPWGKSMYEGNKVVCQFGEEDCLANSLPRCVLKLLRSPDLRMGYMGCEYFTLSSTKRDLSCASIVRIEDLDHCLRYWDTESEASSKTLPLRLNFVPSFSIDGHYNPELSKALYENFAATMCSVFHIC